MNPLKHMAIIMDGNGRWGLKHKNSRNLGHKEGLKTVEMVIKYCVKKKRFLRMKKKNLKKKFNYLLINILKLLTKKFQLKKKK